MSFVFVCLVGDDATREALLFAQRLAKKLGHHAFITAEHPDHDEVARTVQQAPSPVGVLFFGHDGGALRARSSDDPLVTDWASPSQLASLVPGGTIYAFACDSMGTRHIEDMSAVGHATVRAGSRAFLGHCCVVSACVAEVQESVVGAFAAMLDAYVAGEHDLAVLRERLLDKIDALEDLESKGIGALFATSIAVRSAVRGLRLALPSGSLPD